MKVKLAAVALAALAAPFLAQAGETLDRAGLKFAMLGNPFFKPLIQGAADGQKTGNPNAAIISEITERV